MNYRDLCDNFQKKGWWIEVIESEAALNWYI